MRDDGGLQMAAHFKAHVCQRVGRNFGGHLQADGVQISVYVRGLRCRRRSAIRRVQDGGGQGGRWGCRVDLRLFLLLFLSVRLHVLLLDLRP